MVRKTIVCLDQTDAYNWMAHKKIPGFIDKAVRTLERKNQGDLALADEVFQAAFAPTDGQKLLQAGSSAVAQVAQSPAANGFWGMGAAAGPVATNDAMPLMMHFMKDMKEEREKDRQARALELAERERVSAEEREKDRQARALELAERERVSAEEREKNRQARALELVERERVSAEEREKDRQARALELVERERVSAEKREKEREVLVCMRVRVHVR